MVELIDTLEAIRKRPGMYMGALDENGVHHMLYWAFDDIVANCRAGRGDLVKVFLHDDGAVTIADNGPALPPKGKGMPQGTLEERMETFTQSLLAGDRGLAPETQIRSYLPVLRAVSERLEIRFCVRPESRTVSYVNEKGVLGEGEWDDHARMGGEGDPEGLWMRLLDTNFVTKFWPDPLIFTDTPKVKINYETVRVRLMAMAATCAEFKAELYDERTDRHETIEMPNGMADILKDVVKKSGEDDHSLEPKGSFRLRVHSGEIAFDVAIQWHWGHKMKSDALIVSWANTVKTSEGSHVLGLKESVWLAGLDTVPYIATLSVFVPQPRFTNPVKDCLRNPEIRELIRDHLTPALRRLKNDDEFALQLDWMETRRGQEDWKQAQEEE